MTVQELINLQNIKSLLVVFFNLSDDDTEYFYIRSLYKKKTKYSPMVKESEHVKLNYQMNTYFELPFKSNKFGLHELKIKKTDKIDSADKLYKILYSEIQKIRLVISNIEYSEAVMMSAFIPRGSADFKMQYYSVDLVKSRYKTTEFMTRTFNILSGTSVINKLNFNYREFQPEYKIGVSKRDSQLRISLGYFWEKYENAIKEVNDFKYEILLKNKIQIFTTRQTNGNFVDRILEYNEVIINKKNITKIPNWVRQKKDSLKIKNGKINGRDINIKYLAEELFDDECTGCKDIYKKENRTFKRRGQDRYFFEINHVIAHANGKYDDENYDQIDNLVKLCPACHRALSPKRAEENLQKEIIKNMLKNADHVSKYIEIFINSSDFDKKIDFIYSKLA